MTEEKYRELVAARDELRSMRIEVAEMLEECREENDLIGFAEGWCLEKLVRWAERYADWQIQRART